ncbi:hypothetical protein PG989_001567 [Apiospora arundinis]
MIRAHDAIFASHVSGSTESSRQTRSMKKQLKNGVPLPPRCSATLQPPALLHTTHCHNPRRLQFRLVPAPPRLPAEEQAEFERLQRTANTQQGFNPSSTPTPEPSITVKTATTTPAIGEDEGSTIQPNVPLRKGAPPEFEGETNPKTGEVGGPKNEPLRWGAAGDYSFNGRVTDF